MRLRRMEYRVNAAVANAMTISAEGSQAKSASPVFGVFDEAGFVGAPTGFHCASSSVFVIDVMRDERVVIMVGLALNLNRSLHCSAGNMLFLAYWVKAIR